MLELINAVKERGGGSLLLFLSLMLSLLAGCAQPLPASESVEIVFAFLESDIAFYESSLNTFRGQHPDIQVKLRPADWETLGDASLLQADCFVQSVNQLGRFRSGGSSSNEVQALSLDELIQADDNFDLDDFYPSAVGMVRGASCIWAIPAGIDPLVMFYNQDLFTRSYVSYPSVDWTWNDFLDAARALRDEEAVVWGYAPNPQIDPLLFIYGHGGRIFDDLQDPTRTTFDDPLTLQALEWYASLFGEGGVAPSRREQIGPGSSYMDAVYRAIYNGQIGMWSGFFQFRHGRWFGRDVEWPFGLGILPFPRDTYAATYALLDAYVISAKTKHPQACWRWLTFLSRQISNDYRLIPARRSLVESQEYERLVGAETAAVARAALAEVIMAPAPEKFTEFQSQVTAFTRAMEMITAGQLSAQEALEWIKQHP